MYIRKFSQRIKKKAEFPLLLTIILIQVKSVRLRPKDNYVQLRRANTVQASAEPILVQMNTKLNLFKFLSVEKNLLKTCLSYAESSQYSC